MSQVSPPPEFGAVISTESSTLPKNLTLCDYFAIIGFDRATGLQLNKYSELVSDLANPQNLESPLDRAYEAKVLSHFPKQRDGFPFAFEVSSLCMPKGLKFYTERKVPKEPNFHSFVIVREDGSRINGSALIFYEELRDKEIRQQIYDLQMEHIRQLAASLSTDSSEHSSSANPPLLTNRLNFYSHSYKTEQKHLLLPPGTVSFGQHTLPRKTSSKRSGSASASSNRSSADSAHSAKKRISYYDSVSKPIFVAKCLCMVTRIPIVYSSENFLRFLWAIIQDKKLLKDGENLPIESFIYWVLHEVPLPLPGTSLQISFGSACNLVIKRPSNSNELPFFDYPIQMLFKYISVERFMKLFTCFLLEHQILLCSKFTDRLMLVAECLSILIYPFHWVSTYGPILPYSQLEFIESPVSYLMGLCYDDKIPDQIFQSNLCIFDIDSGHLEHPEDIPQFPRQKQVIQEISQLLQRFRNVKKSGQLEKSSRRAEPDSNGVVLRRNAKSRDKRPDLWSMKRMSRSFDNDISNLSGNFSANLLNQLEDVLVDSTSEKPIENVAEDLQDSATKESNVNSNAEQQIQKDSLNVYLLGLKFNQALRELFFQHFVSLFACYEHFLLFSNPKFNNQRKSMDKFDKMSFLSDQPGSYLPFLAAFLETQMFASFVDTKILAQCQQIHSDERSAIEQFDRRISALLLTTGPGTIAERPLLGHLPSSNNTTTTCYTAPPEIPENFVSDYEVPSPHLPTIWDSADFKSPLYNGIFPSDLDYKIFETPFLDSADNLDGKNSNASNVLYSPWKQHSVQQRKQRILNVLEDSNSRLVPTNENTPPSERPMEIAKQNWNFVEKLLGETKSKTKRMLVAKMGKEAVHLGHGDLGITGVEENTLVAGLCDLLERVWTHGLKKKQGKSALWANIFAHHDREKFELLKPVDRYTNLSPEYRDGVVCPIYKNRENLSSKNFNENLPFENSSTLTDLLDSIKNIAKSFEQPLNSDFGDGIKSSYSSATLPPRPRPTYNPFEGRSPLKPRVEQNEASTRPSRYISSKEENLPQRRGRESSVQPILDRLTMLAKGVTDPQQQRVPPRRDHSTQPAMFRQRENNNNNSFENSTTTTNNWSNSFFKAANFIVDKLNNTGIANEAEVHPFKEDQRGLSSNPLAALKDSNGNSSVSKEQASLNIIKLKTEERRPNKNDELNSQAPKNHSKLEGFKIKDDISNNKSSDLQNPSSLGFIDPKSSNKLEYPYDSLPSFSQTSEFEEEIPTRRKFKPFLAEKNSKFKSEISSNEPANFDTNKNPIEGEEMNIKRDVEPKNPQSQARFYHHEERNGNNILEPREGRRRSREKLKKRGPNSNVKNKTSDLPPLSPNQITQKTRTSSDGLIVNCETQKSGMKKSMSMNDFAPHWSSSSLASSGEDLTTYKQSPKKKASLTSSDGRHTSQEPRKKRSLSRGPRTPSRGRSSGYREDSTIELDLERDLAPLPTHMAYDLKNVMRMTEIKTDIGFARAFVRLALERKLLHKHLKSVLSNTRLLQKMYKRYAFLRCEEEREQFLCHILSLNAVDFSCFTHTFILTKINYEVLVVGGIDRFSASSIWIMLTGSLGSTDNIYLPSNTLQFTFNVLVRNNITAQTFCFNCGRWFGRGVDDGALERLLVAEQYYGPGATPSANAAILNADNDLEMETINLNESGLFGGFISRPESPVSGAYGTTAQRNTHFHYSTGSLARRRRSPSVGRPAPEYVSSNKQTAPNIIELQHKLGVSVNALVKHFFTDKDYRSSARLTSLLCAEGSGLVSCLEQVFMMGRQDTLFSIRFFRQPYPWDYVDKVFSWFFNLFRNGESLKLTKEQRSLIIYAYNLVVKISANSAVGKEGKFQIFVLLTLKDHILSGLLPLMAWTTVTDQMYDESAFLRQPHHLTYLGKLLSSLNEFNFNLEKSLTYGIEL